MSKNKDITDLFSNNEIDAAKLAVLAGIFSTLGDGLATISAIMALEGAQESNNNNSNNNNNNNDGNSNKIDELEKQVQYLTKELNKLKNSRK
ncbi:MULTISPECIES: translation initiation factor 2 [unclassified Lysinibacillus]|uniref:translation initiation factor 2 n=1 Tax=unclassified Lysinibacillus TaxID=2636778 RepID=UPI00116E094B|nr:translation initiation factor 2 [Lysinibacillus sp. CD3-6]QPQ35961.1 translation initiation factor 2 [Lysinibacillus sp. JNUCC-52]UED82382.1 translation initiation factor 2 [Lysinibacillus sp. CD3-6]